MGTLLKYGFWALVAYFAVFIAGPAYTQAWKTHKLLVAIAKDRGSSGPTPVSEIRKEYASLAAAAGAYPDADIDVVREGGQLVVLASYAAERRISACCYLQFDFDLASDRSPFRSSTGGES